MQSFVQRIGNELNARAVALLHENGQVLYRHGWIDESDYPAMAALVAAMIAAGKSLGTLGENFPGKPLRFACDSDTTGIYTVAVTPEVWLTVLYEQPLNPGQYRMRVRSYGELLARLGVQAPTQWEVTNIGSGAAATGSKVAPVSQVPADKSSLFADISDDEIDHLFENARS